MTDAKVSTIMSIVLIRTASMNKLTLLAGMLTNEQLDGLITLAEALQERPDALVKINSEDAELALMFADTSGALD